MVWCGMWRLLAICSGNQLLNFEFQFIVNVAWCAISLLITRYWIFCCTSWSFVTFGRMLFCLLPAGLYDHQRKDLPLRDHAPAQIRKVNKPLFWLGKTGVNRGPGSLYLSPTANSFQISPSLSLVLVHFPCANGTKNHTLAATVLPIGSLLFNGSTELLYMGSLLSRNHTFSLTHNGQQRETWEPIFFPCKSHICSTESLVC
jgi:hypothetical protein